MPRGACDLVLPVKALQIDLYCKRIKTRLPFKYGIAVMTDVPHLFVSAQCRIGNRVSAGVAADHLPPKWFTKDPAKDLAVEIDEMQGVVNHARAQALAMETAPTVFAFWQELWRRQDEWAVGTRTPPLLAHFGTSLVERAVIDAFCRAVGVSFPVALRENAFGIDLGAVHRELKGTSPRDWLPATPPSRILCRHTVGLGDPLTLADVPPNERLNDELPQTLEECTARYGLRHFKVKFDREHGLARLQAVAAVLDRCAPPDYACSLDGNEGFHRADQFRDFWEHLRGEPWLRDFCRRIIFVEQPFHRSVALDETIGEALCDWRDRPPLIVDESDGELDSVKRALDQGYAGASHKNCKGVFKGIANGCLLAQCGAQRPDGALLHTGEDLANIGPVALLQDLAVQSALGVTSVERNGHHYFRGLSMWSSNLQAEVLRNHSDLYERTREGWATLRIEHGRVDVRSVQAAPFGYGFEMPAHLLDCGRLPMDT